MALTKQTMTDEQRKSVALEYLKAFDNGGVTFTTYSPTFTFVAGDIDASSTPANFQIKRFAASANRAA